MAKNTPLDLFMKIEQGIEDGKYNFNKKIKIDGGHGVMEKLTWERNNQDGYTMDFYDKDNVHILGYSYDANLAKYDIKTEDLFFEDIEQNNFTKIKEFNDLMKNIGKIDNFYVNNFNAFKHFNYSLSDNTQKIMLEISVANDSFETFKIVAPNINGNIVQEVLKDYEPRLEYYDYLINNDGEKKLCHNFKPIVINDGIRFHNIDSVEEIDNSVSKFKNTINQFVKEQLDVNLKYLKDPIKKDTLAKAISDNYLNKVLPVIKKQLYSSPYKKQHLKLVELQKNNSQIKNSDPSFLNTLNEVKMISENIKNYFNLDKINNLKDLDFNNSINDFSNKENIELIQNISKEIDINKKLEFQAKDLNKLWTESENINPDFLKIKVENKNMFIDNLDQVERSSLGEYVIQDFKEQNIEMKELLQNAELNNKFLNSFPKLAVEVRELLIKQEIMIELQDNSVSKDKKIKDDFDLVF